MKRRIAAAVIAICILGQGSLLFAADYIRVPNAAISGHNTKHLSNVRVRDCEAACDRENWCKSFDFYKGQKKCDLSNKNARDVGGLKTNYSGNPYDHYEKRERDVSSRYKHVPNAAISGHNTKHLTNVRVKDCEAACDRESWCKSFDFYKGQKKCDLSNKNGRDIGGLKTNYSGNPYDHYEKRERDVSSRYKHVPNAAISGHNTKHLSNVRVKDCEAACDSESWCKSFDFYKGQKKCDLSNKNGRDVGGLKTNYPGNPYDHYEKRDP